MFVVVSTLCLIFSTLPEFQQKDQNGIDSKFLHEAFLCFSGNVTWNSFAFKVWRNYIKKICLSFTLPSYPPTWAINRNYLMSSFDWNNYFNRRRGFLWDCRGSFCRMVYIWICHQIHRSSAKNQVTFQFSSIQDKWPLPSNISWDWKIRPNKNMKINPAFEGNMIIGNDFLWLNASNACFTGKC